MYELKLIIRYLLRRRITHFAILTVTLCVFIVVVVMTVMTGLVADFKQKNHEFVGDCVVGTDSLVGFPYYEQFMDVLGRTDFVESLSPVVKNYALLRSEMGNSDLGVEIVGLDPACHSRTTNFGQTLYHRADDPAKAFVPAYEPNAVGCVLGIDLRLWRNARGEYVYDAEPLRIAISLTCFPLNARGAPAKVGLGLVNTQRFYCSDYAHSGIAHVDGTTVYVPLERAQELCMSGQEKRVSAIHVKFRSGAHIGPCCRNVAALWRQFKRNQADAPYSFLLDTVTVKDWKAYRRAFIAPMEKEEALLIIMFGFVGLTSVFIVFVVFYMIINDKKRDIGVLKSVGASNAGVMVLFCGFAFAVGLMGAVFGNAVGWLFLSQINQIENMLFERFGWQLWDRTIYAIGEIPNQVAFGLLAIVDGCAIVACLVGALMPSYLAARLRPVETLHSNRT